MNEVRAEENGEHDFCVVRLSNNKRECEGVEAAITANDN